MTPFRDRLADRLSGGMKQKLALACTLIHTPELLVLDEPTTGVDPVSRRDFWRILARLQRDGLTLLLTTPYLDEAERCQRVALMDKGHILNVSTPERVRAGAKGAILEVLAEPKRRAAELLEARAGISDVQVFGERLHVTLAEVKGDEGRREGDAVVAELTAAGIRVEAARATPPSLEDIFIARMRDREAEAGHGGGAMRRLVLAPGPVPAPHDPRPARVTLQAPGRAAPGPGRGPGAS